MFTQLEHDTAQHSGDSRMKDEVSDNFCNEKTLKRGIIYLQTTTHARNEASH